MKKKKIRIVIFTSAILDAMVICYLIFKEPSNSFGGGHFGGAGTGGSW